MLPAIHTYSLKHPLAPLPNVVISKPGKVNYGSLKCILPAIAVGGPLSQTWSDLVVKRGGVLRVLESIKKNAKQILQLPLHTMYLETFVRLPICPTDSLPVFLWFTQMSMNQF